MKTPRVYFLILCVSIATQVYSQQSMDKVDWLQGKWKRTQMKPGRSGFETWAASSDTVLIGRGVTIHGTDTAFVENIKILQRKGSLYYVADVPENKGLVYFKFTAVTETSFICENALHDFPKKISYSLENEKLKATISGNGKSIDYWFERIP